MADLTGSVAACVLITTGTTVVKRVIVDKKPPAFGPVIAGFGLGTALILIGIAAQNVAIALCVLIAVTALLVNGGAVFGLATPKLVK